MGVTCHLPTAFACVCMCAPLANANIVGLGGLEDYSQNFDDVTNQTSLGNWTKVDSPNPVVNQGELVTSGAFGSVSPRSGSVFLDLRTENQYVNGGDGANYNYGINSLDYGGIDPATLTSGTVDLDFWICPDTWSGDLGFFTPEGIYQTTSLLNGNGDTLLSIGMYSLGDQNSPEVHYSVDGTNWISTGLQATHGDWTNVTMSIDLDSQMSSMSFTDLSGTTFNSGSLAWNPTITDPTVQVLNFQMDIGLGKNFFDDFSFQVTAAPEPSSGLLSLIGLFGLLIMPRRTRD